MVCCLGDKVDPFVLQDCVSALLTANHAGAHTVMCIGTIVFALVLNSQANLHITSLKQIVNEHAIWSPFWGFLEAHNLACSYPQQGRLF